MYGKVGAAASGTLPLTGGLALGGVEGAIYFVAGFTLLAAGLAVGRLLPKRES